MTTGDDVSASRETPLDEASTPLGGVSRAGLLKRLLTGAAALTAGGVGVANLAAASDSQPSLARDKEIFAFALLIERLQAAFYAEALRAGRLTGETLQFAQVVGAEERAHVNYLSGVLGRGAGKASRFHFGQALSDSASFIAAAISLEETGLAAYNGQAGNLTPKARAAIGRVVSVEARHTAWIRALAGKEPAPKAVDAPITAAQATAALRPFMA